MTHTAIQEITPKYEGMPVPLSSEAPLSYEQQHFLGVLASDLVVSVGVASTPAQQELVADNFLRNAERTIPRMDEIDRRAYVTSLVSAAEGRVMTETAAIIKAQNQELIANTEAIREILLSEGLPVELLRRLAPYMKRPAVLTIDTSEFNSELAMPTTAELEESVTHLTDETVSPAFGVSLAFASKAGRVVFDTIAHPARLFAKK